MAVEESCTRVACWLSTQGGLVSFPLITIAGLVDGVNPCAIGMMILLLGYLLMFSDAQMSEQKKQRRILIMGLIYIATVFVTYILIGLVFYSSVSQLPLEHIRGPFNSILAIVLLIAGAIQIKDFFKPEWPVHLRIPTASKKMLMPLIERASIPATIVLALIVTILETPCSLPIYAGTAAILAQAGLPLAGVLGYFFYYNFLFVLPLIIVLLIVWKLRKVLELKEWEHKAERWMKLAIGVVLIVLAAFLGL